MASGLIYLIIIGMWVAYFLPRWMRQHDTQSGRESERYKSAMKIVASTPNFPDLIDPQERSKALKLRRFILAGLVVALLGTALASALSFLPYLAILIPLTALSIYVINVRRQVVAAQIKKRRLAALAAITAVEIKSNPKARIDLSNHERSESEVIVEQWVPLRERELTSSITIIESHEERSWSPIAVPRPTYTTSTKAVSAKRTIDLTTPGKWSAEQERQKALELPERDELFDQELAEQAATARDRAVSE